MKLAVVIISVLLVQTSASFLSELKNSMSSVRSSIGKLFSDAAVDLKDTFDCTVFAVRHAFAGDSALPGYEKCQQSQANLIPISTSEPIQIIISPVVTPFPYASTTSQHIIREEKSLNPTPEPDTTKLRDEIEKTQNIESVLLNDTRVLVNISSKLEHEFEDLSKHVNEDLIKIKKEEKQQSMDNVMKRIDSLLEAEKLYKNNTESEIQEISDKIAAKLDKNNTAQIDLKEQVKLALAEVERNKNQSNVERELKMWKEEELKDLRDIKDLLMRQEKNDTRRSDETKVINKRTIQIETTTESIKFVETSATPETTSSTMKTVTSTRPRTKSPNVRTISRKRSKGHKRSKNTKATTIKPPNDYDSLVTRDKSAVDLAIKLIDRSKRSAAIMASLLKYNKSTPSVFSTPA